MSTIMSEMTGRVAQVTQRNVALNAPVGAWGVIVRSFITDVAPTGGAADKGRASRAKTHVKEVELLIYQEYSDAWEESAYLNDKRERDDAEIKTRRSRSLGKKSQIVSHSALGRMGLGDKDDHSNNVAGTNARGTVPKDKAPPKGHKRKAKTDDFKVLTTMEVSVADLKVTVPIDEWPLSRTTSEVTYMPESWSLDPALAASNDGTEAAWVLCMGAALGTLSATDCLEMMPGVNDDDLMDAVALTLDALEVQLEDVDLDEVIANATVSVGSGYVRVRDIAAAMHLWNAAAASKVARRVLTISGGGASPRRTLSINRGKPPSGTASSPIITSSWSLPAGPAVALLRDLKAAAKGTGTSIEDLYGKRAQFFVDAARDLGELHTFMRLSAMVTCSQSVMTHLLKGAEPQIHSGTAAALEGYLEDRSSTIDLAFLGAVLPKRRVGAGATGSGLDASTMSATLQSIATKSLPASTSLAVTNPQPVVVHVGERDLALGDDESRQDALAMGRDASCIAAQPTMCTELRALEPLVQSGDLIKLHEKSATAGDELRRLIYTSTDVARTLAIHNWPQDLAQIMISVRMALERRIWVSVRGAAAADPSIDAQKGYRGARSGSIAKARPGLFVTGAQASSIDKPLIFLSSMPAGQQDALLFSVLFQISLAMQVAFPVLAISTGRFFLVLTIYIREQRALGASWATLSPWYSAVARKADRRVDRYSLHEVSELEQLDASIISDPSACYNITYYAARAPELAASAATKVRDDAGGAAAIRKREIDAAVRAAVGKHTGKPEGGKGAGRGKGAGKGGEGGGRGGRGAGADTTLATTTTTKVKGAASGGASGKKLTASDKADLLAPDGRFKDGLQPVQEKLVTLLGQWNDKRPCPFFHVLDSCKNGADECRFYH